MKYEIGKEYDYHAVKEWPVDTIFKSLWHGKLNEIWTVTETGQVTGMNIEDGSSMVDKDCVFLTCGLSFTYVPLEFGPEVFKVGDKIQAEDLYKLPSGSILTYDSINYEHFTYIKCENNRLSRLDGKIKSIGKYLFTNQLTIEYIGEKS